MTPPTSCQLSTGRRRLDLSNQYWPDGSLKVQRDGAGNDIQSGYDALGRLATVPDPPGPDQIRLMLAVPPVSW